MENLRDCPLCLRPIVSTAVQCKHCGQAIAPLAFDPDGERIVTEKAANYLQSMQAVGGKIKVTNRRLLFEPHGFNVKGRIVSILFTEIESIGKRATLGIIPNGMFVRTQGGEEHRFVLWGREELIAFIEAHRHPARVSGDIKPV